MGTVSVGTFTSDTETVTRTKLNALAANLVTEFNGNIDNDNIKAAANIAYSKLNLTGEILVADIAATGTPDANKYLRGDSSWASVPAASVTSDEVSAVSAQAASAINVVSAAVVAETSNRTSADNALSNAISVVSVAAADAASVAGAVNSRCLIASRGGEAGSTLSATTIHLDLTGTSCVNVTGTPAPFNGVLKNLYVLLRDRTPAAFGVNAWVGGASTTVSVEASAGLCAASALVFNTSATTSVSAGQMINFKLSGGTCSAAHIGAMISAS